MVRNVPEAKRDFWLTHSRRTKNLLKRRCISNKTSSLHNQLFQCIIYHASRFSVAARDHYQLKRGTEDQV